jgi:uncharacterized membrane protein
VFVQVCCSVVCILVFFGIFSSIIFLVLGHQMMDKVQKYTSINANTPLSETYRSDLLHRSFITKQGNSTVLSQSHIWNTS